MGFGAVGVIMLVIVFIFYMRMVDARASQRHKYNPIDQVIERANVFESLAKDSDALKIIDQALVQYPDNSTLLAKRETIIDRLNDDG